MEMRLHGCKAGHESSTVCIFIQRRHTHTYTQGEGHVTTEKDREGLWL